MQHICAFIYAEIAQLVEHFTRNEGVAGSSPVFGFLYNIKRTDKCVSSFFVENLSFIT